MAGHDTYCDAVIETHPAKTCIPRCPCIQPKRIKQTYRIAHREAWDARSKADLLVEAFACWLKLLPDAQGIASKFVLEVRDRSGARRTYKDVAASGFLVACEINVTDAINYFREGLGWLARRQTSFDGVPTGVAVDGVALLGLAVGAACLNDEAVTKQTRDWLSSFLPTSLESPGVPAWQKLLMRAAGAVMRIDGVLVGWAEASDVFLALVANGITESPDPKNLEQSATTFLALLRQESEQAVEPERLALRLAAFNWVVKASAAIAGPIATVEDVRRVLRRLETVFYRWTWEDVARTSRKGAQPRCWHLDNEYHLQNLLWVVLAPLFPDLKEEEFTDSVGQLQPRTDLVIPSLALIIEAKFMYLRTTPREMIEQIAADNSLYLKRGSHYRHIIPVIWDDGARTEEHTVMIEGLKKFHGVYDVIVVSRPAVMRG